ncbi:Oidioi.mRNA.OKI2018_I69.chr2.g4095.t1.cds [Oikopleura dioica]|uniref:Oidioi.mRNA.OKI2018_I69.chr2.g4095.t1.cds n=1 Tax=Oikopleura dioica TaxID=34765 RepID=A0ABN7SWR2_OIKDI|nr:Oidioi.mRNA.OKI2018_I69.chr2.g4095.t1.cds [Oikopleura dioica]
MSKYSSTDSVFRTTGSVPLPERADRNRPFQFVPQSSASLIQKAYEKKQRIHGNTIKREQILNDGLRKQLEEQVPVMNHEINEENQYQTPHVHFPEYDTNHEYQNLPMILDSEKSSMITPPPAFHINQEYLSPNQGPPSPDPELEELKALLLSKKRRLQDAETLLGEAEELIITRDRQKTKIENLNLTYKEIENAKKNLDGIRNMTLTVKKERLDAQLENEELAEYYNSLVDKKYEADKKIKTLRRATVAGPEMTEDTESEFKKLLKERKAENEKLRERINRRKKELTRRNHKLEIAKQQNETAHKTHDEIKDQDAKITAEKTEQIRKLENEANALRTKIDGIVNNDQALINLNTRKAQLEENHRVLMGRFEEANKAIDKRLEEGPKVVINDPYYNNLRLQKQLKDKEIAKLEKAKREIKWKYHQVWCQLNDVDESDDEQDVAVDPSVLIVPESVASHRLGSFKSTARF